MNPNPAGGAPAGSNAKDALNVPSILLMITGGIGVLSSLSGLAGSGANAKMMAQLANDPNMAKFMGPIASMSTGPAHYLMVLLGLAISGFIIFGALKMRNAQAYGLAMGSAIVAMLPCWGCCCIGLPVGIWALVLMMKPEIKSQFSA